MTNTKIIKLMGGVGNQMFQYAFGSLLEQKYGAEVLYDTSYFDDNIAEKTGLPQRFYELGIFPNINIKFASKDIVEEYCRKKPFPKIICQLFGIPYLLRDKTPFKYNKNFLKKNGNIIYEGYFQNEKYYESIKDFLKKSFQFPPITDSYNQILFNNIYHAKNSVFIHVRRSEYVNLGMDISIDYYKKAAKYMAEHLENPTFFVFCSEDTEYIKKEFDIGYDFELIGENNTTRDTFFENMRLMMACEHAIIANSSYSWWAAYLSDFKEKIVIAPSPWLNNQDDVICSSWIKIKSN